MTIRISLGRAIRSRNIHIVETEKQVQILAKTNKQTKLVSTPVMFACVLFKESGSLLTLKYREMYF